MTQELSRQTSGHALFTIGEVINRLLEEFPEMIVSYRLKLSALILTRWIVV
ncbi:MAG: hypothetical protein NTW81_06230 [Actinobacteria bacterium]|nr:hypothetical protein [Actinomycetota bacterium]